MTNKIKETRKTSIALENLHLLVERLEYYFSTTTEWVKIKDESKYIQELILELSTDKKTDHARLASKLKNIFFKENTQLKSKIKELEQKIEELKNARIDE